MSSAPSPRRAGRLRRCLWALLLLAVAGELGLRLFDFVFDYPTGSLYDAIVPHGERFKLTPGGRVIAPERYGDVEYRFNQAGYRDRDHEPRSTSRRLVLLGDSVTFGLGAPRESTFAARLEPLLAERHPPGFEVVNLAVFAYDTRHELAAYREDGRPLKPRVVVAQFYLNDFSIRGPAGEAPPLTFRQRLTGLKNLIVYRSNLYRRLFQLTTMAHYRLFHDKKRLEHPEELNRLEPEHKQRYLAERPEDEEVPAFVHLTELAREVEADGGRFLLMLSPDEVQLFDARYDDIHRRFDSFTTENNIALLDLLPVLRGEQEKHTLFLDGVHLAPRGHAVVAEALADELERLGFLR